MRKDFEMTQEQLDVLLDAGKPVLLIALNCGMPRSPQQNANDVWKSLGREMGFQHMTVKPICGGERFFSAEEE